MPIIGNNHAILSRAEGQSSQSFYGSLVEQHKALLVVREISARSLAIQLAACLAPDLYVYSRAVVCTRCLWGYVDKLPPVYWYQCRQVSLYKGYLGKESFVVNPDTVNAVLLCVKVANFLTIDVPCHAGVPSISILIIPASLHWCLLEA